MKKFSHTYKLKKDTPKYKKGWELKWDGEMFYFREVSRYGFDKGKPGIYLDRKTSGYTLEEIQNTDWFEPVGELVDFIPKFPSKKNIEEFVYLNFETRLVDTVDECRTMNNLFKTKKFQDDLYKFIKEQYNTFYKLTDIA